MITRRKMFLATIVAALLTSMITVAFNIWSTEYVHASTSLKTQNVGIFSEALPIRWNRTYGGPDYDLASALVMADDGSYALVGVTASYGSGEGDIWLVKTDAYGNALWNRTYGGSMDDIGLALVLTNDGGYALAGVKDAYGSGEGDFWLVKTDEYGVVPEFPSILILSLFMIVTLLVAIVYRKKDKEITEASVAL